MIAFFVSAFRFPYRLASGGSRIVVAAVMSSLLTLF
jgi:hypothetical protein